MLTKDTIQFISGRVNQTLSYSRLMNKRNSEITRYRVQVPDDKLDLLTGMTLDNRYYVLSLLGQGGMSLVYKAKDLKTAEIVAVKCLRTQVLKDEMVVKRFKREADVLNRLNHPRIVQFFGYGTNNRGQPYFIMDYLIGTSLGEILRTQGALELGRFQDVFVQVAAAIGHAHKHGAIHRDIKPGNIMLVEKGQTNDYVKIVDFGIAKVTEGTQKLTRVGEVWGSPIYMSPEQCMGTTNVDSRTDIYSLGIVMYEALTGEVPFLGRNYADTMMKQISEDPQPFKQIRPNLDIPTELELIVFRAIQKKAEARYQTMGELKQDLERALNSRPDLVSKEPLLTSISGKHQVYTLPESEDAPIPFANDDELKRTADQLQIRNLESIASEMQQRITSDEIPQVSRKERLKPEGKPVSEPERRPVLKPQIHGDADLNFDPDDPDRSPFQLTGPQVIAASTDTHQSGGRGKAQAEERMKRSSTGEREMPKISSRTPGSRRKERASKSNLQSQSSEFNFPGRDSKEKQRTTYGAQTFEFSHKVDRTILIAILIVGTIVIVGGIWFANKGAFDGFLRENFFLYADEMQTTDKGDDKGSGSVDDPQPDTQETKK
ncbi:MAG: serine/threonine protein kinase [Candidatus Obscuribacterales bacterium]|nr:serine/threonine protein kinase [Candidatus Obscuribacterales bacterium]